MLRSLPYLSADNCEGDDFMCSRDKRSLKLGSQLLIDQRLKYSLTVHNIGRRLVWYTFIFLNYINYKWILNEKYLINHCKRCVLVLLMIEWSSIDILYMHILNSNHRYNSVIHWSNSYKKKKQLLVITLVSSLKMRWICLPWMWRLLAWPLPGDESRR